MRSSATAGPSAHTPNALFSFYYVWLTDEAGQTEVYGTVQLNPFSIKKSTTAFCLEISCIHLKELKGRRKASTGGAQQFPRQYVLKFADYAASEHLQELNWNTPEDLDELITQLNFLAKSSKGELISLPFLA
jgi:hypothetical protein